MRVVLSSRAVADIARIGRFIARDNPRRAVTFVKELRGTAQRLGNLPHGFPLVPRYERHGIRRRLWKGYGILYSALPDRISFTAFSALVRITIARWG